jgi:alpha-ketoglutarate-dependent taurine dioxygenase
MPDIPVFAPLGGGFGAVCAGFDLARPLAAEARTTILAAFVKHQLLVFRAQALSADAMRDFAAAFGEVEGNIFRKPDGSTLEDVHIISNLGASGLPDEDSYIKSNYNWHTDKSYLPVPALMTMLQAIELPPHGGDTEFADMTRAYAALPAELRSRIDGLEAIHSFEYMRSSTNDRPLTAAERAATPPVPHPLVRTHPETGEKSLYLGMYCSHIAGMDEAEGRALIQRLQAHATSAPFMYVHRWQPGDLVLWDNRCLLHRATMGFDSKKHRRVLQRAVVRGTAPR